MSSRRSILGYAAAAGFVAPALPARADAASVPPDVTPEALPPLEPRSRFWAGVEYLAKLGPRHTGNKGHRELVDYVEAQLRGIRGMQVHRDRAGFTRWEATRWGLALDGAAVPVASCLPYSGVTAAAGVEAELAYVGVSARLDLAVGAVRGKIAVVDVPVPKLRARAIDKLRTYSHDPGNTMGPNDDFTRAWVGLTLSLVTPLEKYRRAGAVGVIMIVDASPAHAAGQYAPWLLPLANVPGLVVDREAGRRLRDRARAGGRARLTLEATVEKNASTHDIIGVLPGLTSEVSIVNTHTDGPNALEENGVLGVLALARQQAALPLARRRRTHVFLFSTGHFAAEVGDVQRFMTKHGDLLCHAASAVTVEHLGAMEWVDGPRGYRATGRSEPMIAFASNNPALVRCAIGGVKALDLRRTKVLRPFANSFFLGPGGFLNLVGVPTIGFLSGPSYLVSTAADGHLGKLSSTLAYRQLQAASAMLARCDATPMALLRTGGTLLLGSGCVLPKTVGTAYDRTMDLMKRLSTD